MTSTTRSASGRPRPPFRIVAIGSLAAFAAILGGEALRMHQGHDPALQTSSSSSSTASTQGSSAAVTSEPATSSGGAGLPSTQSS
jgi:hypothetical protein